MANTSFNGPVRSENGFQVITIDGSTGAVTVNATYGSNLAVPGTVILTGLPTSDPNVAGAVWSNSGVLTLSATV